MKSKLSTAKKSKTTTFSRVFYHQKIDNFLGKSKLNFWPKNEDFEQCVYLGFGVLSWRGNLSGLEATEVFFIWSAVLFNVDIVKSNPWVCGGGSSWSPCSSGTDETSSLRKSNRLSDLIHIFLQRKCRHHFYLLNVFDMKTYKWLGVSVRAPRWDVISLAFLSKFSTKSSNAREIMTGTGWATLPTSSSVCMIFLIRAWKLDRKRNLYRM